MTISGPCPKKTTSISDPSRRAWWQRILLLPIEGLKAAREDFTAVAHCDFRSKYKPLPGLLLFLFGAVVSWWIYVPVHEFMHVGACCISLGTVQELTISPEYGGRIFERLIPWVRADSEYPGRVTGFQPGGDLGYLITDFGPFLLTFIGVYLLRRATRSKNILFIPAGIILAFAPFLNIFGDFHEMGTVILSAPFRLLSSRPELALALRSDDLIKQLGSISSFDATYAWGSVPVFIFLALAFLLGIVLSSLTYLAGRRIAERWER